MIALQSSAPRVSFSRVTEQRHYSPEECQQVLRSVMTEKFRRWLMKKALQWTDYDWERSQDLVQDTFLSLLRSRTYDPNKSSPTYYAVWRMRGLFTDRPTAASRMKPGRLKSDPVSRPMTISAESREIVEGMRKAISHLPDREYAVIQQRMDGIRLRDIADQQGVSRQWVSLIEQNALSRLAEMPLPVSA